MTESVPSSRPRVIVVEDNSLVAKFFQMALERAGGFSVFISEDVPEIIAEVEACRADAVLLDVSLTNSVWDGQPINGIELCRLLKSRSPRPLPVMLVTAHAMSGDRERFIEASGADGYLEKPVYDSADLVAKVRELLR